MIRTEIFLQNKPYEIEGECVDLPISNLGLKWVAWAIFMLIYLYTRIHTSYIHTCIQTYRHTDIKTYGHTDMETYRQTYICIHTSIQAYFHTYIHTKVGIYVHIHIHTHIHTVVVVT